MVAYAFSAAAEKKCKTRSQMFSDFWMLFSSGPQQDRPRDLKGGGHLLGETAEHFFSEGAVGQLLRACDAGDWKVVKQLAKAVDPASKPNVKDICAKAALVKQTSCKRGTSRVRWRRRRDDEEGYIYFGRGLLGQDSHGI